MTETTHSSGLNVVRETGQAEGDALECVARPVAPASQGCHIAVVDVELEVRGELKLAVEAAPALSNTAGLDGEHVLSRVGEGTRSRHRRPAR